MIQMRCTIHGSARPPLHELFFFVVLAFKSEATDIEFPYTFALAISRGLHIGSFQLRRGGGVHAYHFGKKISS